MPVNEHELAAYKRKIQPGSSENVYRNMIRNLLHRKLFIATVLFWSILNIWGCGREGHERPQMPVSRPYQSKPSSKPIEFRFGVIHYTHANIYAEPNGDSECLTQAIYGDLVRIEDEQSWWYAVKIGPHPELSGWIYKAAVTVLTADASYLKERNLATIIIRQNTSQIFVWPSATINIVMGTELPFIGEAGQWYLVRLPNNDIGRIEKIAVNPTVPQPLIQLKQPSIHLPKDNIYQRREIINTARKFLGKLYVWGGTTPRGFDCSGLSYFVYKLNGIELPRISALQFQTKLGTKINKSQLQQADLVFFQTYRKGPSHVGIYIGNDQFIHASPRSGVTIGSLNDPYFKTRYVGAKTLFSTS